MAEQRITKGTVTTDAEYHELRGRGLAGAASWDVVAEWIDAHYKPDRLHRDAGSRERIIADRIADLVEHSDTLISRHDSMTGRGMYLVEYLVPPGEA